MVLIVNELDVTVSFVTSEVKWKNNFDLALNPNDKNGLKSESLVRLSKIATLDKDLILGRLGSISQREMNVLNNNLIKIFQIN